MKRLLAMLLSLCLTLGLFAGGCLQAAAEGLSAQELDEVTWKELKQEVYRVNQRDALIKRHSSLKYSFDYSFTPDWKFYVWETADGKFTDWLPEYASYERPDRVSYCLNTSDEGERWLHLTLEMITDYEPFYNLMWIDEESFLDFERESFTGSYTEDGLLHILTEFDESKTQELIDAFIGGDYAFDGGVGEMVLDPETLEIVQIGFSLQKDGEVLPAYTVTAEFDTPEPDECIMLRTVFEREANMMTVTAVSDAGTDREFIVSAELPKNSGVSFESDEGTAIFSNPEYTRMSNWDCMSDMTFYFVSEPGEALADRSAALATEAFKERGPALDPESVTLEDFVAANMPEAIFARHENLRSTVDCIFEDVWSAYYEDGANLTLSENGAAKLFDRDGLWELGEDEDGETYFGVTWYAMSDEEREADLGDPADVASVVDPDTTIEETLVSVTDNEDGTMTIVALGSEEAAVAYMENRGFEDTDAYAGAVIECDYYVAADTLELLWEENYFRIGEERVLVSFVAVCYDTARPEELEAFEPYKEEFLSGSAEETRTVAFVYDAGTEKEERYEITVPRDYKVNFCYRDGYDYFYQDAEKTVPGIPAPDEQGNRVLYAFAEP